MPFVPSLIAYNDIKAILDRALETKSGLQLTFATENEAHRFRQRANHFRVLDRAQNAKIYIEPAHEMHGASIYDKLMLKKKKGESVVTVEIVETSAVEIAEL